MEKRISYSQFQSVKCVAKACDPLISKRNKLGEKLQKIAQEYKDCDTQIQSLEAGIVSVIGLRVQELVKKVIEPGVDVNGLPKKTTKYLPTDIVSYDEQHKQYVITIKDNDAAVEGIGRDTVSFQSEEAVPTSEEINIQEAVNDAADEVKDPVEEVEAAEVEKEEEVTEAMPTDAPIFE